MPETITNDEACYSIEIVKAICAEVGPGLPGSPQERNRAGIIQKELESHLGAENVIVSMQKSSTNNSMGSSRSRSGGNYSSGSSRGGGGGRRR